MESRNQRPRRVSTALVRHTTDWGVSVSEKRVRKNWLNFVLLVLSVLGLFCGAVLVMPFIFAMAVSAEITGIGRVVAAVLACVGLAVVFNILSRKGPRNAIELDSEAGELRIGSINRNGAFVRHRVLPLARIQNTAVERSPEGDPELNFMIDGESIRVALANGRAERMDEIALQVTEAASRARNAGGRSRIRSAIAGIGASYREIGNRVTSRVFH
ncbi:MAG: hypothetical protein HKP54_05525 [Boseongicola sp.]|nr:hypothetical protein [Boseongicola sp.]